MVTRGAGAAGPVLLACRQWDPCGLARSLPSLGAGAWRGAPLLHWRVQCPGRVCAALAAGLGGLGRCQVSCPPRLTLPAPRFLRCVWRAVQSGCPLPSLAGTPFHAVCAFRGLGPVALLVFPACPLCVCALALPRRPRPPYPPLVAVARTPRAVPVLGAGRAVARSPCPSACPALVPCPVLFAFGGGGRSRFPPTRLGAVCSPWGGSAHLGRSSAGGCCGGGGGLCAVLPDCAARGASGSGGRLALVRPSAFPGQATKRVSLALLWPWRAWPQYRSGLCSLAVTECGPRGALVCWRGFACPLRFLREQAAGAWRRALLQPPSRAPRSCRGEGDSSSLPRGGGAGGHGGGVAPWLPTFPLLGGWACGPLPSPPSVVGASSAGVRVRSGPWGSPGHRVRSAAGGPAWRGGGGGGGGHEPPPRSGGQGAGGPGGSLCPGLSLCPPWVGNNAGVIGGAQVMGGAAPILLRFPVACRPRAWSVRRSCALVQVRPPYATPAGAGGGGRGGTRRAGPAASPPGRCGPLWRRGEVPSASGGWRAGVPMALRPGGGSGGGGGERGPRRCSPLLCPGGVARGPRPCRPGPPPLGIHVQPGLRGSSRRRVRPGRLPVGQCGGGGGVRGLFAAVCSPAFPGRAPRRAASSARSWVPPFRCSPGRRQCRIESTGGAWRAAALVAAVASPPWVPRPSQGGAGPPSLRLASGRPQAGGGGVGGRGGSPQSPPGPPAPPPDSRGGAAWWLLSWGASRRLGGRTLPPPPPTTGCQTLVQTLARARCSPRCRRGVPAGRRGRGGGECWGR